MSVPSIIRPPVRIQPVGQYRFQPVPSASPSGKISGPGFSISSFKLRWALVLLSGLLLIPNIQNTSNPGQGDEVMHIATVHDSLESDSILYPELNGFVNYYKPPLLFWLGMASEKVSEWLGMDQMLLAERIISVFSSALAALFIFELLLLYRAAPGTAFLWAAMYLSTLGVMKFGRLLMFEQIMAAHILATLYLFARWLLAGGSGKLFSLGLLVGSSYLYKGALVPIYLVLGLLTWAFMQWVRTSGRFRAGINAQAIGPVIRAGIPVMAGAIIPLVAYALYLMGHPRGMDLVNYFLVFENAAKFVDANQGEWILLQGIILYSLPWTFLLLGSIRSLFRSSYSLVTPARQFAWLLVLAFLAVLLFHLVPHRKADYYMLPLFGLLFVAGGLAPARSMRSTQWLVVFLSITVSLSLVYLGHYLAALTCTIPAMAAIYILISSPRDLRNAESREFKQILPGLVFSLLLPFTVFPAIFPPLLSGAARERLNHESVCIISENPWSALAYGAVLKESQLKQRHPDLAGECDGSSFIVEHDPAASLKGYRVLERHPVWKEASAAQYWNHLGNPESMQRSRIIYERNP